MAYGVGLPVRAVAAGVHICAPSVRILAVVGLRLAAALDGVVAITCRRLVAILAVARPVTRTDLAVVVANVAIPLVVSFLIIVMMLLIIIIVMMLLVIIVMMLLVPVFLILVAPVAMLILGLFVFLVREQTEMALASARLVAALADGLRQPILAVAIMA